MTVPLAASERRFMCSQTEHVVSRKRAAVSPDEPAQGQFLVWRVLGFGGRSNPIVYSRIAGLVARMTQALATDDGSSSLAELWSQLYVGDPAYTFAGPANQRRRSIN